MPTSFKQIRPDKDISQKENGLLWLIIVVIIASLVAYLMIQLQVDEVIVWLIFLPLLLIFSPLLRRLDPDWTRKRDIVGTLIFSDDYISMTEGNGEWKIYYKDLNSLTLNYNYIQGKEIPNPSFFAPENLLGNGLAEMVLTNKDGQVNKVKFLVETKAQFQALKPVFTQLYKLGIKITEKMGNYKTKTILFESNLNYAQIQKLKAELNVDSFH